jgi:hypothetical protein
MPLISEQAWVLEELIWADHSKQGPTMPNAKRSRPKPETQDWPELRTMNLLRQGIEKLGAGTAKLGAGTEDLYLLRSNLVYLLWTLPYLGSRNNRSYHDKMSRPIFWQDGLLRFLYHGWLFARSWCWSEFRLDWSVEVTSGELFSTWDELSRPSTQPS